MEKHYIGVRSVENGLSLYEEQYGMSTQQFYAALQAGNEAVLRDIPRRRRHAWGSLYRTLVRMRGDDDLADHIKRDLACA